MISEEEALQEIGKQTAKIEYSPVSKIPEPKDIFPKEKAAPKSIPTAVPALSEAEKKKHLYMSENEEIPRKKFTEKILPVMRKTAVGLKSVAVFVWEKIHRLFSWIDWQKIFSSIKEIRSPQWRSNLQGWSKNKAKIWLGAGIILLVVAVIFISRNKNIPTPPVIAPTQTVPPAPATLDDIQVKNVENISEVAALPSGSRELLLMNDALFVLSADKSILKINPANGETENADSSVSSGKFTLAAAMPDLGTIFILTEDKKMISFTPNNKKFQENNIAFPENAKISDIKTYLTYIYLLDPTANQIYRYPRAEGGFGEKQDWLKAGTDIKNSVAFGINEDLFIATKTQIIPFLKGNKDDKINFENPNIPLAIDKIFAAPGFENIYVLDNKNHRVAVYSKDGKIAAQYWNKSIAGIKDFAVDEKNKVIYLQKTGSLSRFSME
jgi:hypothetical protein